MWLCITNLYHSLQTTNSCAFELINRCVGDDPLLNCHSFDPAGEVRSFQDKHDASGRYLEVVFSTRDAAMYAELSFICHSITNIRPAIMQESPLHVGLHHSWDPSVRDFLKGGGAYMREIRFSFIPRD